MGALDLPFKRCDLSQYLATLFDNVERGPEAMHDYQRKAVQFLIDHPYSALFIDLGLGKTCISLTAIMRLIMEIGEYGPWLVIGPKRVVNETWPTEIGLWRHTAPLTFTHVRNDDMAQLVNDAGRAEREKIRQEVRHQCRESATPDAPVENWLREQLSVEAALLDKKMKARVEKARIKASAMAVRSNFRCNPATVHLVNREQVEFLVDAWGRDFPYANVIIDESSCFKDHTTNRFKALRRVRPLIKRMHQLTATPAAETYMHLFAQIFLLDEGQRFGRTITHFRERYFTQNRWSYKWDLRPGAEEEIAKLISDISLVMKAEDFLTLERPVSIMDNVKLDAEQMALYKRMEEDQLVELDDGTEIEAETAAAAVQKLQQIASGVIYETKMENVGNGRFAKRRVIHQLHDHKIDKLRVIVEEAQGETLLVAYWHESSLANLKKAFPKAVVMDAEGKCIKQWNAKKIPMLLVHPSSAGHGLNLQYGGRRIVLFDIPWSLELYLQLIGRLARQGQKYVVMVHHIIAEGTIDEHVVEALVEKRNAQELLFKLLKKHRKQLVDMAVTKSA